MSCPTSEKSLTLTLSTSEKRVPLPVVHAEGAPADYELELEHGRAHERECSINRKSSSDEIARPVGISADLYFAPRARSSHYLLLSAPWFARRHSEGRLRGENQPIVRNRATTRRARGIAPVC